MPRATGRPAFPGAETALLPLLWAALATVVPANHWPQLTFIDAFLGSGAVTAEAKARYSDGEKARQRPWQLGFLWWILWDSNPGPTD